MSILILMDETGPLAAVSLNTAANSPCAKDKLRQVQEELPKDLPWSVILLGHGKTADLIQLCKEMQ